jgi:hypothetical protein
MPLSDAEYEDVYREALLCLADDGRIVETPFYNGNGVRYCLVDNRKLTDEEVLKLWWHEDITRKILKGRAARAGLNPL